MAELPEDLDRLISTALNTAHAFGMALHTSSLDETSLVMEFQERAAAERFRKALVVQRQAYLALAKGAADMPIEPSAVLEALPTKPLDVELRQWAVEQAIAYVVGAKQLVTPDVLLKLAADFAKFASDKPKPEDPA